MRQTQTVCLVFIGLLAVLAASCAPSLADTPATPTRLSAPLPAATPTPPLATQQPQPVVLTPKKGGAFTYGSQLRQIDHDPHASASILFDWDLVANGLLDMDNDTQAPKPDLAERWEVSKDGKVYTFYLRKGVKFQNVDPVNGRELTADDVVYSFERIRTNHPRFIRRSLFSDVVAITAPDRYTIQFSLREPLGPFLVYVASNYNKVVAKEVVDKFGDLQPKESTIGTGPYMVKTWRDPLFAEMVRNPDYWDKDRPSLDVARFQVIEDDITRVAALRTGQIDVAPRVPPSAYESVKTSTNIEWDREAFPSAIQMMFRLDRKPWNDVRVRRAVHLAIDRDDVISGAHEGAAVISGPLPPLVVRWAALQPDELRQMPGYRQPKGDDIAEAKRLLAEAGYPHGFEATMPVSDYSPLVNLRPPEVIQNQLQKIGVQLNFRKLEQAAYIGAERRGDFEVIVRSIGSGDIEPDAYLSPVYTKEGSRNPVGLYDPRLEDLLLRGRRSLDREERRRIYRDAQLLIIDQAYRAYIDEPFFYTGKRKSVRNYNGQWTFDNRQIVDVWLDR